ncbi:hypothetical protein HanXRQr2_Chr09g0376301 [Helianthus annuus]|nr:hypothetical protein HanXRQr2_Chr09g0376301 [Helianthus annuus]
MKNTIVILVIFLAANILVSAGDDAPGDKNKLCTKKITVFQCNVKSCYAKCQEWNPNGMAQCLNPFMCLCTKLNC